MQNDGGIKRGDRADTGDLKARRTPGTGRAGSGVSTDRDEANSHPSPSPSETEREEAIDTGVFDETDIDDRRE